MKKLCKNLSILIKELILTILGLILCSAGWHKDISVGRQQSLKQLNVHCYESEITKIQSTSKQAKYQVW